MPTQDELLLKLIYQEENKKALDDAASQLDKMTDAEKALIKEQGNLTKSSGGLNDVLKSGSALLGGAVVGGLLAAGAASIKLGMDMEQTKVAFTTLTGSAEAANKHLQDLRDFAAGTPFQFTELTEASKRMMAFGFETEKIVPMLRDIGDASAALGLGAEGIDRVTRALGQMQAKGKVTAEEMMQLTESGLPGWKYLAEAMGKTTAEVMDLSKKGLIPAGAAIDDILAGMRKDFGGMMEAQSKTAAGQLSNLVDSLESIGTSVGEILLPAIKAAIGVLGEFAKMAKTAADTAKFFTSGQEDIAKALDTSIRKMRDSVIAGKMTTDEYNTAVQSMVNQIWYLPPAANAAVVAQYQLTDAQFNAMQGAYGYNGALDESTRAAQRNTQATTEAAAATDNLSKIATPTELGMRALAQSMQQGGDAGKAWDQFLKDNEKSALDAAKAQEEYQKWVISGITAVDAMAASLMNATDAQVKNALASAQIAALKEAYDAGVISADQLAAATNAVMINNGMATEKSLLLSSAQDAVTKAFLAGKVPLEDYLASDDKLIKAVSDGRLSFDELTTLGLGPAGKGIEDVNTYIQDLSKSGIDPATGKIMLMADTSLPALSKSLNMTTQNGINPAKSAADNLKKSLEDIPTKIDVVVNVKTNGAIPGAATTTTPAAKPGTGKAAGANFVVPPGYPNDTYPLRVTSGERVIVEPRQAVVNNSWNVTADMAGMALLLERQRMMNLAQFEARM